MGEDRKFNTLLDRQISAWFLKQARERKEASHLEGNRVWMECVNAPKKNGENADAV